MSYITILSIFLVVGIMLEFIFKPHLFDSLKERILWTFVIFVIGIVWDTYAVLNEHWIFPGNDLVGIYIGVLPIEEFLFFLIPPYFALTLATVIKERMK
jgi:lycopene cyclase domain-containing protein